MASSPPYLANSPTLPTLSLPKSAPPSPAPAPAPPSARQTAQALDRPLAPAPNILPARDNGLGLRRALAEPKKETVRKITNQTLSQSVPPSVITTINGYTKLFIGELIDRARRVQEEWTVAAALGAAAEKERQKNASANGTQPTAFGSGASDAGSSQYSPRTLPRSFEPPVHEDTPPPTQSDRPLAEMAKERDKGPLTPDMLREALRRYKKDQEGGGTGFVGLSLEGRERAAVRTGGKRIFR
ncbi:hypothetical protein H2199_007425 [Coniosporium tulheliwenetii]|uniref:Uncharacterized protein n=1 Tax=Coniosporium tulheliwenetii TaxID=3383036 RepID=A0ACC2YPA7_9PEZI|nr:hypothetical protein H2199_007425 [Cladosporium sp. JES 115]